MQMRLGPNRRLVVIGATGATGARVVRLAADAGLQPVAVARRREALATLTDGLDADARIATLEPTDLDRAFADAAVVVSGIGPSTAYGAPIIEACLRAGASYVDFSGEARWVDRLASRYGEAARSRGVTLVPSVGLGVAGDLAAAAAAAQVGTVRRLTVGYRIVGMRPSVATTRSTLEIIAGGAPLVGPDGVHFVPAGPAHGPLPGVRFPTPDPLVLRTVYRDAEIQTVMGMPAPTLVGRMLALGGAALRRPRLSSAARRGLAAWADRTTDHADAGGGDATVTVFAEGDAGRATAVARVADVYETTGRGGFLAARTLLTGDVRHFGLTSWGTVVGTGCSAAESARIAVDSGGRSAA